jgi:hypothetical protein
LTNFSHDKTENFSSERNWNSTKLKVLKLINTRLIIIIVIIIIITLLTRYYYYCYYIISLKGEIFKTTPETRTIFCIFHKKKLISLFSSLKSFNLITFRSLFIYIIALNAIETTQKQNNAHTRTRWGQLCLIVQLFI